MKFTPIFTEKSMNQSKNGQYSFWVLPEYNKNQIKAYLETAFDVKIADIKTTNYKKMVGRSQRGTIKTTSAKKKVLVTLKSGKIELFDTETKSKGGKK